MAIIYNINNKEREYNMNTIKVINLNSKKIKMNLRKELLIDLKEKKFNTKSQFIKFFYNNYIDYNKFENEKMYQSLLLSDRDNNNLFFDENETINFLINERMDLLDVEKLRKYGII